MRSAIDFARWSSLAYSEVPIIGAENSAARIVEIHDDIGLVLAIPGTNNAECVKADIDALLLDANDCGMVHAGIWGAFQHIVGQVIALDGVVALTGHSEGGAGAIMLGAVLCVIGKPPKAIYAFEPPHLSIDDKLQKLFEAHGVKVYIYHHGRDIIPMLPPPIVCENWQHCAPVIQFGGSALPIYNVTDHEMKRCIADITPDMQPYS